MASGSKLRNLRTGKPLHKKITLGNGDSQISVAIVILNSDTMLQIEEKTEEYCQTHKVNNNIKTQYYNRLLVSECMRDPDDTHIKLAESEEEIGAYMDLEDISRVVKAYQELMVNKAPKIEFLSQEDLDELKKHLEVTSLNDLSTVLQIHLKSCHQTLVSES